MGCSTQTCTYVNPSATCGTLPFMLFPLGRLFASVEELRVIRVPFSFYKTIAISKTGYTRIFRYVC